MSVPAWSPIPKLLQPTILFAIGAADFNVTTDQPIHKLFPFAKYRITRIWVANASISLGAAVGGVYMGNAKAGAAVVAASQGYAALTGSGKILDLTLADVDMRSEGQPTFALTTPQGVAATADIYVEGVALS